MGNKTSNVSKKPHVLMLLDTLNLLKLKTGSILDVPIRMISMDSEIKIKDINDACMSNENINKLSIKCFEINKEKGLVRFIIPSYYQEMQFFNKLEKQSTFMSKNDEDSILFYHQKISRRIWENLEEYFNLLNKLIQSKIDELINKKSNGSNTINITANYWSSDINGRYLYELGNYAIKFPLIKNIMLEKIIDKCNNDRISYKAIYVENGNVKDKPVIYFFIFVDIEIN